MVYHILETISEFGLDLIYRIGYFGVFLVSLLENIFTPIPSEAIIPMAGVLVAQGRFDLTAVILASTLGSLVGAYVFYGLGYIMGSQRIRGWIVRWGKYLFISEDDLDRAERWFRSYGSWAVLLCRVVPLVRSFISIPAGYVRMPLLQFTLLTLIGTAVWSTLLVYLGVLFGENYTRFLPIFKQLDVVVVALIVLFAAYWVYRKLRPAPAQVKS
jgi:membrane protein DedA with SNARE-associated domain